MPTPKPSQTFLWSFGRLLRRLRGSAPLHRVGLASGFAEPVLLEIESGTRAADEWTAREVLRRGLGLSQAEVDRLVLGVKLYDLGLRDNEVRQLVIDLLLGSAPPRMKAELARLYRSYAP